MKLKAYKFFSPKDFDDKTGAPSVFILINSLLPADRQISVSELPETDDQLLIDLAEQRWAEIKKEANTRDNFRAKQELTEAITMTVAAKFMAERNSTAARNSTKEETGTRERSRLR